MCRGMIGCEEYQILSLAHLSVESCEETFQLPVNLNIHFFCLWRTSAIFMSDIIG